MGPLTPRALEPRAATCRELLRARPQLEEAEAPLVVQANDRARRLRRRGLRLQRRTRGRPAGAGALDRVKYVTLERGRAGNMVAHIGPHRHDCITLTHLLRSAAGAQASPAGRIRVASRLPGLRGSERRQKSTACAAANCWLRQIVGRWVLARWKNTARPSAIRTKPKPR